MTKFIVHLCLALSAIFVWGDPAVGSPMQFSPAEQAWLRQHPQVRVRISPAYPPFEFFDQGQYQGMAYDYLMLVSQHLGIEFVPVPELTWSQSLESLRNHDKVDLILLITRTPERERHMNFTHDYINFPWVIFSRKDAGFIGQLADLGGKTVAVEQGYITAEWLQRDVNGILLKEFPSSGAAIEAVALNSADAYVGNLAVGTYMIERQGLVNLKVAAPTPYGGDPMGMAVRKDWPELAGMIDRVVLGLTNAEHQAIRQKWLALRVEHGLRPVDIVKWMLAVGGIGLLWVGHLRWTVSRRTGELRREVQLRQEKEKALEQQSAQLTSIFDSLEAVVYVADMETHRLLHLNRHGRLLFGDGWEGRTCYEFFHQSQQAVCPYCTNDLLVASGVPQPPYMWEHFNGKTGRWYQVINRAIPWPDGRLVRLEIAIDITERKEMDRMKDEMLSTIGHEVRTPLAGMAGYAELMMEMEFTPEQRREFLAIICRQSERLAEMFDNVLNLQALKVVNVAPDFQNVRIGALLKGATDLFRGASRDHQLQLHCEDDLPVVKGEPELLHRVFLNLISNAIKYSPAGGLVSIAAYRTDAAVIISVADEGIGIAKPVQDRIFESFFRVDNTDSRRASGTGLGLALVREAVSQHGGRVWVESEVGKGSTFFVSLPASESEGRIF